MCASSNQSPILRPNLLNSKSSALTSPGTLNLRKDPLVRPEVPGIMEVDRVVKTDHHANLLLFCVDFPIVGLAQCAFQPATQVLGFSFLQFLERPRDILVVEIRWVFERIQGFLKFSPRSKSGNVVDARDASDEIAIGDVGKGGKMGLVASGVRNMTSRTEEATESLVGGVERVTCTRRLESGVLYITSHPIDIRLPIPAFRDSKGPPPAA